MKNILLSLLGIATILICAFFWLNSYIYTGENTRVQEPARADLVGTYLCLPVREDFAGVSDDCAVGLRTDQGVYYAVDLGLMSMGAPQLVEGNRISASGVITPIEQLSTDYWDKYTLEGIFSVTDSLQVLKQEEVQVFSEEYAGVLPCATCAGVDTRLTLRSQTPDAHEGTFTLIEKVVDTEDEQSIREGTWQRVVDDMEMVRYILQEKQERIAEYVRTSEDTLRLWGEEGDAFASLLPYDLKKKQGETGVFSPLLVDDGWTWAYTQKDGGEKIEAPEGDLFVLTFTPDDMYMSTTDCNSLGGKFAVDSDSLQLEQPIATKMFCADSQEFIYTNDLLKVDSFVVQNDELQLIQNEGGVMVFVKNKL